MLYQLSYAPGLPGHRSAGENEASLAPYTRVMQRRALGLLFAVLAAGLGAIAFYSASAGGGAWVLAVAAGALAVWMGSLALRALA